MYTIRFKKSIVLFAVLSLFAGCIRDDDATVLLPLPLGDIQGVKVPEGMLDHLQVNEGTTPPEIEGKYVADHLSVNYTSDDYWNEEFYTLYMAFTQVEGRNITTYIENQNTSSATTNYSRVIGSGNDFTVYFLSDMSDEVENWSSQTLTIISGTMTPLGIENFQYSNAMIDKTDPENKIMNIGEYHVFNNAGHLVKRQDW